MQLVDRFDPTITTADALRAASAAWARCFGRLPDWDELVLTVAWGAHETDRWKKAANNNPFGLTCGAHYPGPCFSSMTHEYVKQSDGTEKKVPKRRLFRSFPTLEAGMSDGFDILKRGYPQAVDGLRDGDVKAFVAGLYEGWGRSADWATAPQSLYLKAVAAHVPEAERELAKLDGAAPRDSARLFEPETFGEGLMDRLLDAAEAALWLMSKAGGSTKTAFGGCGTATIRSSSALAETASWSRSLTASRAPTCASRSTPSARSSACPSCPARRQSSRAFCTPASPSYWPRTTGCVRRLSASRPRRAKRRGPRSSRLASRWRPSLGTSSRRPKRPATRPRGRSSWARTSSTGWRGSRTKTAVSRDPLATCGGLRGRGAPDGVGAAVGVVEMTYRTEDRSELERENADLKAEVAMLRAALNERTPWWANIVRLTLCGLGGAFIAEHRPSLAIALCGVGALFCGVQAGRALRRSRGCP